MNIAILLQAAEYLERRDRESEHGYASTLPMAEDFTRRRSKSRKSQGNRSTHNELEKNRRANLRHCLERLKEMVPVGPDSNRHTTLGLLTKAKLFIKALEDKERKQRAAKEQLCREQRHLRRKLDTLSDGQYRVNMQRSFSECSTSTNSTSSASSESDEVDIMGYGSSPSDVDIDDRSSTSSESSGCTLGTQHLTLLENL